MPMSKKDFIALADKIRSHNHYAGNDDSRKFTDVHLDLLVEFCRSQNPRFMEDRWLGYIRGENGPSGGKR